MSGVLIFFPGQPVRCPGCGRANDKAGHETVVTVTTDLQPPRHPYAVRVCRSCKAELVYWLDPVPVPEVAPRAD